MLVTQKTQPKKVKDICRIQDMQLLKLFCFWHRHLRRPQIQQFRRNIPDGGREENHNESYETKICFGIAAQEVTQAVQLSCIHKLAQASILDHDGKRKR